MHNPPTSKTSFLELIQAQQALLNKTDLDISIDLGFRSEGAYSLIRSGAIKPPINSIEKLAHSLELNPADLLHTIMVETMPDVR